MDTCNIRTYIIDVTLNPDRLKSRKARLFVDPADKRYKMYFKIEHHRYSDFALGWLIRGLEGQEKVKCLIDVGDIVHERRRLVGRPEVHGSIKSVRNGLVQLPINQSLPLGTRFKISVSNKVEITQGKIKQPTVKTLLTGIHLKPQQPIDVIPFNRRTYIGELLPNEVLEARYQVGYNERYSLKEITDFERDGDLVGFGTQLDTHPIDLLSRVIAQLREKMDRKSKGEYRERILQSGFSLDEIPRITNYINMFFDKLLSASRKIHPDDRY